MEGYSLVIQSSGRSSAFCVIYIFDVFLFRGPHLLRDLLNLEGSSGSSQGPSRALQDSYEKLFQGLLALHVFEAWSRIAQDSPRLLKMVPESDYEHMCFAMLQHRFGNSPGSAGRCPLPVVLEVLSIAPCNCLDSKIDVFFDLPFV